MPNSRRYNSLVTRIRKLSNTILPPSKPSNIYTAKEQDLIRAFVVLSHAEIEAFLEDVTKDKATKELRKWISGRKRSNCLKSIASYVGPLLAAERFPHPNDHEERIKKIVGHFIGLIRKNNGVKESDVLSLVLPIGVEYSLLDPVWLQEMETFGTFRGSLVHTTHQVQLPLDRDNEYNRIMTRIIPELGNVDLLIKSV